MISYLCFLSIFVECLWSRESIQGADADSDGATYQEDDGDLDL